MNTKFRIASSKLLTIPYSYLINLTSFKLSEFNISRRTEVCAFYTTYFFIKTLNRE